MKPAVSALLLLLCPSCHWLAGNPDATLNGAVVWRDARPSKVQTEKDADRVIWVRVRDSGAYESDVRVLFDRVRQVLREEGWRIEEERDAATVWLDLDIRYWGENPVKDEAGSTYAKVLRDRRPDLLADGEKPRGGRFSARSFLTPAEAVISSIVADVIEYDFIVDLHLKRNGGEQREERQTMIVWVRQIDLEREVATKAVGDRVLEELRSVFRR